jgi:hypothetical protein
VLTSDLLLRRLAYAKLASDARHKSPATNRPPQQNPLARALLLPKKLTDANERQIRLCHLILQHQLPLQQTGE